MCITNIFKRYIQLNNTHIDLLLNWIDLDRTRSYRIPNLLCCTWQMVDVVMPSRLNSYARASRVAVSLTSIANLVRTMRCHSFGLRFLWPYIFYLLLTIRNPQISITTNSLNSAATLRIVLHDEEILNINEYLHRQTQHAMQTHIHEDEYSSRSRMSLGANSVTIYLDFHRRK